MWHTLVVATLAVAQHHHVERPHITHHELIGLEKPISGGVSGSQNSATRRTPQHAQPVLRFGVHLPSGAGNLLATTEIFVRGASWRSQTYVLCTMLGGVQSITEMRPCSRDKPGDYEAETWLFVPETLPALSTSEQAVKMRNLESDEARLRFAHDILTELRICEDICANGKCLPGTACKSRGAAKFFDICASQEIQSVLGANQGCAAWDFLGSSFVVSALTLPQPFHIVEDGNRCGYQTIALALLRRIFCPQCTFTSIDPAFPAPRGNNPQCDVDNLRMAGLRDDVRVVWDFSGALPTFDLPVGFVYVDDGKLLRFNDPFLSLIDTRIMVGAMVVFDDAWQENSGAVGQITTGKWLVEGGFYVPVMVPKAPELQNVAPTAVEVRAWASTMTTLEFQWFDAPVSPGGVARGARDFSIVKVRSSANMAINRSVDGPTTEVRLTLHDPSHENGVTTTKWFELK